MMVDIDKMEAGRKVDARVAEKVMEWERHDWQEHTALENTVYCSNCGTTKGKTQADATLFPFCHKRCNPPSYSTDWGAAGEVVEKLETKGFYFTLNDGAYSSRSSSPGEWYVADFQRRLKGQSVRSQAPTAQLAICRAALKAVELLGESDKRHPKDMTNDT